MQKGDAQSGADVTKQEDDKTASSGGSTSQTQPGTNSAGQEIQTGEQPSFFSDNLLNIIKQEDDKTVSSGGSTSQTQPGTNSAGQEIQTGEQPSSFFDNLLNIIMKPFSLIASFFGGFFSWLFGSDEPSTEFEQSAVSESTSSSGGEEPTSENNIV